MPTFVLKVGFWPLLLQKSGQNIHPKTAPGQTFPEKVGFWPFSKIKSGQRIRPKTQKEESQNCFRLSPEYSFLCNLEHFHTFVFKYRFKDLPTFNTVLLYRLPIIPKQTPSVKDRINVLNTRVSRPHVLSIILDPQKRNLFVFESAIIMNPICLRCTSDSVQKYFHIWSPPLFVLLYSIID